MKSSCQQLFVEKLLELFVNLASWTPKNWNN